MSANKKLKDAYNKISPGMKRVEQDRVEVVELTESEQAQHRLERDAALQKHAQGMIQYEDQLAVFNANSDRSTLEKPKAPKRVRYRKADKDPHFAQVVHLRERVRTQFTHVGGRFSFTSPPKSSRLPPPSRPLPQPYERTPPHLLMSGVPEDATEFDRPARAHQMAKSVLEEAKDPNSRTRPIVVDVDEGQHVAITTGNFKLTEDGSTRHYHLQRPHAIRESENGKVARVYQAREPQSRLFEGMFSSDCLLVRFDDIDFTSSNV